MRQRRIIYAGRSGLRYSVPARGGGQPQPGALETAAHYERSVLLRRHLRRN